MNVNHPKILRIMFQTEGKVHLKSQDPKRAGFLWEDGSGCSVWGLMPPSSELSPILVHPSPSSPCSFIWTCTYFPLPPPPPPQSPSCGLQLDPACLPGGTHTAPTWPRREWVWLISKNHERRCAQSKVSEEESGRRWATRWTAIGPWCI